MAPPAPDPDPGNGPPPAGATVGTLTLVIGGARSGKSGVAEVLLEREDGPLLYLATGSVRGPDGSVDHDMAARVARHVARRGERYATIEAGAGVVEAVRQAPPLPLLLDSLGTWVAAHFDLAAADFPCDPDALVAALRRHPASVVVVGEEVGLGVHPETAIGRRFRDVLGTVNQTVASAADHVLLVAAGRVLPMGRLDDVVGR